MLYFIGRASVVSSAPLAILSLLPSILLSIAAWVIRSTLLENNEHGDTTDGIKRAEEGKSHSQGTVFENEPKEDMSEKHNTQPDEGGEQHDTDSTKDNRKENNKASETQTVASNMELAVKAESALGDGQDSKLNRGMASGGTEIHVHTVQSTDV